MHNVIIPTDLIEQHNTYAMVVYAILQTTLNYGNGEVTVMPEWIGDKLGYEFPLSRKKREKINNTFKYLNEFGYLKKYKKYYKVNTDNFYNHKTYTKCNIFVFDELCCTPNLLRHYLVLKDCVEKDFSLEYYANREGVAPSTIRRYNRDLESLGLIKINTATYNPASGKRCGNNSYTVIN